MALLDTDTMPSVAQVARRIDGALRDLGDGWVEGEVRSIKLHRPSGHCYLTLADEQANLDACIWRARVARCHPLPSQGDLVRAHYERVDFHAPRGATKLVIDRITPTGEGELLRRRAETLRRLEADGLCDPGRRRTLVRFPRRIGVIGAPGSEAETDVIRHLRTRFPAQDIVVCPAAVQGVRAVGSVIDALGRLQAVRHVDVVILARGGGSVADLVPFDDERLCRAIFACAVPVITSIGHTRDRPNCDQVAAASAPVPARAAEYAIGRSAAELLEELDRHVVALGAAAGSLRRRGEHVAETGDRLRPRQRMTELAAGVGDRGELLSARAESNRRARELGLDRAARGLGAAALRLPRPTALEAPREALRTAAAAYLADQGRGLTGSGAALEAAARRIPRAARLDVPAAQLDAARSRAHERRHGYGRALDRLGTDAHRSLRRRLDGEGRVLRFEGEALRPAAERVLARARERAAHLAALLAARDLRRRGWVLAADAGGRAVRTVAELAPGSLLELRFADGRAAALVQDVGPDDDQGDPS